MKYGLNFVFSRCLQAKQLDSNSNRLVGSVLCEQQAFPYVKIDAFEVNNDGQVVRAYTEETRHCSYVRTTVLAGPCFQYECNGVFNVTFLLS